MIELRVDDGEVTRTLMALTDPTTLRRGLNAGAEQYVEDTLDFVAGGKSFTPRTGRLEQSISWRPGAGMTAEISADAEHAPFVEFGTKPHVIRPKGDRRALKIPISGPGGFILRRAVNHPGTDPMPFFFAEREARQGRVLEKFRSVLVASG